MLSNPIYIGKIRHKGALHDGEHKPIIDAETFETVQRMLSTRAASPKGSIIHSSAPLLSGRLFDEQGNRLTPVHTQNHGKRYRYYVTDTRKAGTHDADAWRIPGSVIELIVEAQLLQILRNRAQLAKWIQEYSPTSNLTRSLENAAALENHIQAERVNGCSASIIRATFSRIALASDIIRFEINIHELLAIIANHGRRIDTPVGNHTSTLRGTAAKEAGDTSGVVTVTIAQPIVLKRRGTEIRIVVEDGIAMKQAVDQTLVDAIAKAHLAMQRLTDGSEASIADVAGDLKMDASDLSRILPLAFLSPELAEAILTGRQPADLTSAGSRGGELPIEWAKQDELLTG